MSAISVELQVADYSFPVLRCSYGTSQATDSRGRVIEKVRRSPVELLLDVPAGNLLDSWASDPMKHLAVDIVFRDAAGGLALETLHMATAYCVGYREVFESGDTTTGAYQCLITLVDPSNWTLTPGGPTGAQQAYLGNPFVQPLPTLPPVPEPILPEAAAIIEESVWARVGAALLRVLEAGTSFPMMLAALLLMPQTANAPGLPHHPPLLDKDTLRLAELEHHYQAGGALSQAEQAEYLSLLARVRGIHWATLHDSLDDQLKAAHLRTVVPDFSGIHLAGLRNEAIGEFDGVNIAERLFIEDKSALGLTIINQRTGLPFQPASKWADKQIYGKTTSRINALKIAKHTYPVPCPNIEQIRDFRRLHFRLDADTPDVRQAVGEAVTKLKAENPDWEFSAQYGIM